MAVMKQFSVTLENRRGALAELCSKLAEKAVNIRALSVPDETGVATVRFVVDSLDTARKVFDSLGVKYDLEDVLAVSLVDRPGSLGKLTRKLADHGFDVRYVYGSILKGSDKAMIILAVSDVEAASKVLK